MGSTKQGHMGVADIMIKSPNHQYAMSRRIFGIFGLFLSFFLLLPVSGANATAAKSFSCFDLNILMDKVNYQALEHSSQTKIFKINNKIQNVVVTQYLIPNDGRFLTYYLPENKKLAIAYDKERTGFIDLYCKIFTPVVASKSSGAGSLYQINANYLDHGGDDKPFTLPDYSSSEKRGGYSFMPMEDSANSIWFYLIPFFVILVFRRVLTIALTGKSHFPSEFLWLLLVTLAMPVIFVLVSKYFGGKLEATKYQGVDTWVMITLAAFVIFFSGIFTRQIWFSVFQAIIMWFVIVFNDRIFELDRLGTSLVNAFFKGNLSADVYNSFSIAIAFAIIVALMNKSDDINRNLKSVFVE